MKKLRSILLSVAIVATLFIPSKVNVHATTTDDNLWTNYADEIIPNEKGVYEIRTPKQLAWVAKMTNEAPTDSMGMPWSLRKKFSLMNSIDISAHQWVPIGTFNGEMDKRDNMFYGIFEGNGNTIDGLTIQDVLDNVEFQTIGLFGAPASYTEKGSEGNSIYVNYISDLFLKNVNIQIESFAANPTYVGSITGVGQINLYNCSASGSVKTKNVMTTGGLSGMQKAAMTKCVNNVDVEATFDELQEYSYVGGVAGDFVVDYMTACISNGDIIAYNIKKVGGLTGQTQDLIQISFSTSNISATSTGPIYVGSTVGSVLAGGGGKVLDCFMAMDINMGMLECGHLKDNPIVEITGKTLDHMKTKLFIDELARASENAIPGPHLAKKYIKSFQSEVSKYYLVNGLVSSVQPTNYDMQISANVTIPTPTYTITIPSTIDFGEQTQALEKYKDEAIDQYGNEIKVSQTISLFATGVANLFNDLDDGKDDHINVSVAYDGKLVGEKNTQNEVPFLLTQEDKEVTTGTNIATFYNDADLGHDGKPVENTATAQITMNRTNITKADRYNGKLTFTIAVAMR